MSNQSSDERACKHCDAPAFFMAQKWACARHHRYTQMRKAARNLGKVVPTFEQLDAMPGANLICPTCDARMNWFMKDGGSTVAALQHYRDGTLDIVCLACNARHGQMPGDTFRDLPKDHKLCPKCAEIKPHSEFYTKQWGDRKRKIKSECKRCSKTGRSDWEKQNKDLVNAAQRRRYHAKKVALAAAEA